MDRVDELIGRAELTERLTGLVEAAWAGACPTALVSGQAGIGKTALLRACAARAAAADAVVGWGTCINAVDAPGYWPWTQLFASIAAAIGAERAREIAGADLPLLRTISPLFGEPVSADDDSERARLLSMDATTRWFATLSEAGSVLVVLDDLHWADGSSVQLLEFVTRMPHRRGLCVLGAYRHDEIAQRIRDRLGALVAQVEHLPVGTLDAGAARELVRRVAGPGVTEPTLDLIHRRAGGHPLFTRQLALLTASGRVDDVPDAVREAIERRLRRLPERTRALLEVAAVLGFTSLPDVLAAVLEWPVTDLAEVVRPALDTDVLVAGESGFSFTHDLLRETLLDRIDAARLPALHRAAGAALAARQARAADVPPSAPAGHFTAAVALDGTSRATRWTLAAAAADRAALAFAEAAARLSRLRGAVADAGIRLPDPDLVDVLLVESDSLARSGRSVDARGLLRLARDVARRGPDPVRIARVALATAQLGSRFAARRDEMVGELEGALDAVAGVDAVLEARVSATLARELAHSVAEDRPRAGPLSVRALELGRRGGDPATIAACLLARHDVLWTPGVIAERVAIAAEIEAVARDCGDDELHAQGLLLRANALLEQGSSAFEAPLNACLDILERLDQPRHRYTAATRRACLALLHGQIHRAESLIEAAAELGGSIREPDTGNVRMSQRLELVRARAEPDELRAFADEAVAHWVGAPVHAHAVAAGFRARAADLADARRHLDTVLELGSWQADRSYLWSVFIREFAYAACALADTELCARLFADVEPLAGTCGVNGAVVAFAGAHAHTAGLLAAALGRSDRAAELLDGAAAGYARLGAAGWLAEVSRIHRPPAAPRRVMRRAGPVWQLEFEGTRATVPHAKGLTDIARLIRSGTEVHVLDLHGVAERSAASGELADRTALNAYRRRLAELDGELARARDDADLARAELVESQREALIAELGKVTGLGGRPRRFVDQTERARKAVAGRIRDVIRRLEPSAPELAAHLDRAIVTGIRCRYQPREGPAAPWYIVEDDATPPR